VRATLGVVPLGPTQPRVAHAHPLTADARASRAAVAFRRADRETARIERRRAPRRVAIPATGVLAVAAALVLASQAFAPAPLAARSSGDRAGAVGSASEAPGAEATAAAVPAVGVAAIEIPGASPQPAVASLLVGSVGQAVAAEPPSTPTGYRWPLEHARITQAFGPASTGLFVVDGHRFHDGIDIANFCGAPILAAHAGTVVAAGRHVISLLGWTGDLAAYNAYLTAKHLWGTEARVIVIDDGNGYRSVYIHLHRIDVTVGQVVKAGQQIGLEGNSGHATGCHLHYSLYRVDDPGRWTTNPSDVTKYHLPTGEIARVDPIDVLPPLATAWITWGWGTQPQD
jgi:murein DD-endopeptidase MepM/ murein hydrolase activator NlpD